MMNKPYDPGNGVKPRYDGDGSEFSDAHREIGTGYYMFDIDRMHADIEMKLELRRKEEGFVEYRVLNGKVTFPAMFEIKHKRTPKSELALMPNHANTMAMVEMARRLDCRAIVVFATDGHQPFEFHEFDTQKQEFVFVGTLDYRGKSDRGAAIKAFWNNVLKIHR